jgi:hypothetical protein
MSCNCNTHQLVPTLPHLSNDRLFASLWYTLAPSNSCQVSRHDRQTTPSQNGKAHYKCCHCKSSRCTFVYSVGMLRKDKYPQHILETRLTIKQRCRQIYKVIKNVPLLLALKLAESKELLLRLLFCALTAKHCCSLLCLLCELAIDGDSDIDVAGIRA